ncbi:MAG: hypothetical protein ACRD1K_07130 [Acidimicrobiales bacterium]
MSSGYSRRPPSVATSRSELSGTERPTFPALVILVILVTLTTGCGGSGGGGAACGTFGDVQRSLQAAAVTESPADLAAVDRRLQTLVGDASGELATAAKVARRQWTTYRRALTAEPRNELALRQLYTAALQPLEPFTAACGSAL